MADVITNIKNKVIQEALARKIVTEDEVKKYVGKYIDEFGFDSFVNYLSYLIQTPNIGNMDVFLTLNQKMLVDKKELESRFGLKIISPDKVWEGMADELSRRI
jgi:hypothetical protein